MMFRIEIDDFWLSEEDDLEPALKRHIIDSVVTKITKKMQSQIENQIVAAVNELSEGILKERIDGIYDDFIAGGTIEKPGTYRNDPTTTMPIKDYLKELFAGNRHWNPESHITRFCKDFGEELKLRYNAAFANQIVANLKEQGMLKDEVVNALLSAPKESGRA